MGNSWGNTIAGFQKKEYEACNMDDDVEMGVARFILAYKELARKSGATDRVLSRLTFIPNKAGKTIRETPYYEDVCDLVVFLLESGKDPQDYVVYHFQEWDRNYKAKMCKAAAKERKMPHMAKAAGVAFPAFSKVISPKLRESYSLFNAGGFIAQRHLPLSVRSEMYSRGWEKKIENWSRGTGNLKEDFWLYPNNYFYSFLEHPGYICFIAPLKKEEAFEALTKSLDCGSLEEVSRAFKLLREENEKAYEERKKKGKVGELIVDAENITRSDRKRKEIRHKALYLKKGWNINGIKYLVKMLRDVYPEVAPPTRREFAASRGYNWGEEVFDDKWFERFGKKETWDILTDSVVNPYDIRDKGVDPESRL